MSITKVKARGRTRYLVRYREPNNPYPKNRTFDTKDEAQAWEDAVRVAKRGGVQVRKASNQTLEAFGVEYLTKYARVELAPSTLSVMKALWNKHVLPKLGAQPLAVLAQNPALVQEFKAELLAEGVGQASVRKTLAILQGVMSKAVEWGRIQSNPVATVRKPSGKRQRVVRPIAPQVVEELREAMPTDTDKRLISLLAYSGLRPGEALALTGADVGERTISVTKALAIGEVGDTKTGHDRVVPLLAVLADDLRGVGDGLIFPREDGEPWQDHDVRNWRTRVWQPACQAVGIGAITVEKVGQKQRRSYTGAVPYDMRHSFASLMLSEGVNPIEVAEYLGHSPAILFSTYAHVIAELRGQTPVSANERIRQVRAKSTAQV